MIKIKPLINLEIKILAFILFHSPLVCSSYDPLQPSLDNLLSRSSNEFSHLKFTTEGTQGQKCHLLKRINKSVKCSSGYILQEVLVVLPSVNTIGEQRQSVFVEEVMDVQVMCRSFSTLLYVEERFF